MNEEGKMVVKMQVVPAGKEVREKEFLVPCAVVT
jgi:hypothetical protein